MAKPLRVLLAVHPQYKPDRAGVGSTEFDVWQALKKLGHNIQVMPLDEDFHVVESSLKDFQPDIVFNLVEEFRGEAIYDFHLVSFLEARGISFTGCNPRGLVVSRNKLWVAHLAGGLGLRVPRTGLHNDRSVMNAVSRTPLFVKYNREHASLGISNGNRVTSRKDLASVVARMRNKLNAEILLQEFIPGTEVTVSVWGNRQAEAFPPWQLHLGGDLAFATERVKFSSTYRRKRGIRAGRYRGELADQLKKDSVTLFQALDLSGYARFDYRLSTEGVPFLIDVNPNPNLSKNEDFATSSQSDGCEYVHLIEGILKLGLSYRPKR